MDASVLLVALNLVGAFVFAVSGAVVGQRRGADVFGALVLAFVTAVAGGVVRDLVIGAVPPEAFANWHLLAISIVAGLCAYFFPRLLARLHHPVEFFDAVGLGVFAVTGTQKALQFGLDPVMAAVLGMVSGIGGGMLRDILTNQIPIVLRSQIYALAALAAAAIVSIGWVVGIPGIATTIVGIAICLVLRLLAIYRGWNLPLAGRRGVDV